MENVRDIKVWHNTWVGGKSLRSSICSPLLQDLDKLAVGDVFKNVEWNVYRTSIDCPKILLDMFLRTPGDMANVHLD